MKHASVGLILSLVLSLGLGFATAAQAARYEAIALPNTVKANAALFRIEVASGQVVSLWGNGATQFIPSADKAVVPAGEYHLYKVDAAQPDGTVYWSLYRMDANNGRVWNLTGGGDQPYVWVEATSIAAPVTPPAPK